MSEKVKVGVFENLWYWFFNICSFGALFTLKVIIKKAVSEVQPEERIEITGVEKPYKVVREIKTSLRDADTI